MNVSLRLLFVYLLIYCPFALNAQVYKGMVADAESREPIAFVNIVYSQGAGAVTDIDGRFEIRTEAQVNELRVSCLGYESKVIPINAFSNNDIIYLMPQEYQLQAVNVLPGENPALVVMKRVVDNKRRHNPDNYDPFSCIIYHKMTLDFEWPAALSEEEKQELRDSLGIRNDSYLFLFESVSEKKHWKKGLGKEKILSGRVSGLKDPILASFPAMIQPFSFYDPQISLLGYAYLNPASKAGLSAYRFILEDTYTNHAGDSIFYISYRPREERNFRGLTGTFHIDGKTSAIKTVAATTAGTENGMRLFIRQNYQPVANGTWFPKQLESSLELGGVGVFRKLPFPIVGKGKSYVTAINTQPQMSASEFDNVVLEDLALEKDAPDVAAFRYEPLTSRDSLTYHFLDSIGRKNHLDAILKTQISLVKGYVPMGKFQLDLSKLVDYNDYEGLKLGAGLYTSPRLSKNFTTGGYYTYGFGDKAGKFGVKLDLTPFANKENKLYARYYDDVYATGTYEFIDGIKNLSSERFSRFMTETMDLSKGWEAGAEFRFAKYFKTDAFYKQSDVSPQKVYRFDQTSTIEPAFNMSTMGVRLKWAHKETFSHTPLGKISNGTNWPVIWINALAGQWEADKEYDFTRFESRVHKQFNYPNSMYTTVRVEGGYMDGDYPGSLLYSALGSYKSFTVLVPYSFGTMRLNEFAANQFAAVYFSHGFPLALNTNKRIKPEIVLSTNVAFGDAPAGVTTFRKGYYESGLYLKNLFSNFIFQYGLSVHYRYGTYSLPKPIDNWAFKLGLEFAF